MKPNSDRLTLLSYHLGGPLKVEVHRRESSSSTSSSSSCNSVRVTDRNDTFSSHSAVNQGTLRLSPELEKFKKELFPRCSVLADASEAKVSVEASALHEVIEHKYPDNASTSPIPVDPENFPSLSPVSQGLSLLSEVCVAASVISDFCIDTCIHFTEIY